MLQFSMPTQTEPTKPVNFERQSHQNNMVSIGSEKNSKPSVKPSVNSCPRSNKENTTETKISEKKLEVRKSESENWLAQRMSKTENDTLNDVSTALISCLVMPVYGK